MFETEMAQIAVEENKIEEEKLKKCEWSNKRQFIEDKRSRLENDIFEQWSAVQEDKEVWNWIICGKRRNNVEHTSKRFVIYGC